MSAYTICPKFLEFAKHNKKYITDVLMVFVPDNSKTISIDSEEKMIEEYEKIIHSSKELTDWYKFLSMFKDNNFTKISIQEQITNLPINICENTYDKLLISDCTSHYSEYKGEIDEKGINILDKDLAKVQLNYGNEAFPQTSRSSFENVTPDNIYEVVSEICNQFKDVVENKGLFKLLVDRHGDRVPEKKAQLLFFGVAYSHCYANDLKLSPEVDSGNGPVDFNVSRGMTANVNVEMKFADNPKLDNGLWSQLKIYNNAENATGSIYLVIKTNNVYDLKLDQMSRILNYRKNKGEKLPDLFIVDSTFKLSASVR